MSFFDAVISKVQEATPTWLGGTGGNLTAYDQSVLVQDGIDQINSVPANASEYYGEGSDAALAAQEAADYNTSLVPGDVAAVAAANAKANGQCSLLSVVNGQAPFNTCYPSAKWYALGAGIVFLLWLMAPYVSILAPVFGKRSR